MLSLFIIVMALSFGVGGLIMEAKAVNIDQRIKHRLEFADDFESYAVGSFPYAGGWEDWFYGGAGTRNKIVDTTYVSPTKSFQLLSGFAARRFESDSRWIGFQVNVKVTAYTESNDIDNARLSFTKETGGSSSEVATVLFLNTGIIAYPDKDGFSQELQSYETNRWYEVTVLLDRKADTLSVWIDDVLLARKVDVFQSSGGYSSLYEIEAFSVSQIYNSATAYFDDVVVFS